MSSSDDIGEKMHRLVSPFDAPWMKRTDSDALTDYPRKLADSYIQNRLPAVGMTRVKKSSATFETFGIWIMKLWPTKQLERWYTILGLKLHFVIIITKPTHSHTT